MVKQTKLQLAVVLAVREHTKTLKSFISLNKVIDQWLKEFCWSFWLN